MKVVVFEVKGTIGHFRRPDTTGTHLTYPFITRTAAHGLIASVLGKEKLSKNSWIGIKLLSPVKTRAQEMSMLGKGWISGGRESFNRPTSIELVVKPHYRIFYAGDEAEEFADMIKQGRSWYHTYLGSAYCLTFPIFKGFYDFEQVNHSNFTQITAETVVPTHAIRKLIPTPESRYGRVGGMHYEYLNDRVFKGTINVVYDYNGKEICFVPQEKVIGYPYKFLRNNRGETICLW